MLGKEIMLLGIQQNQEPTKILCKYKDVGAWGKFWGYYPNFSVGAVTSKIPYWLTSKGEKAKFYGLYEVDGNAGTIMATDLELRDKVVKFTVIRLDTGKSIELMKSPYSIPEWFSGNSIKTLELNKAIDKEVSVIFDPPPDGYL